MDQDLSAKICSLESVVYVVASNSFIFGHWALWTDAVFTFICGVILINCGIFLLVSLSMDNVKAVLLVLTLEGVLNTLIAIGILLGTLNGMIRFMFAQYIFIACVTISLIIWISLELVHRNLITKVKPKKRNIITIL